MKKCLIISSQPLFRFVYRFRKLPKMTVSCSPHCHLERSCMSICRQKYLALLRLRVERSPVTMRFMPLRREISPLRNDSRRIGAGNFGLRVSIKPREAYSSTFVLCAKPLRLRRGGRSAVPYLLITMVEISPSFPSSEGAAGSGAGVLPAAFALASASAFAFASAAAFSSAMRCCSARVR